MNIKLNQKVTHIRFINNKSVTLQNTSSVNLPEDTSRVFLFVVESYSDHITGGRYHIWEYALALCELGYSVVWLSNCYPIYLDSFTSFKYLDNLHIIIQSSGSPTPFIFERSYYIKHIVGTPLGCIESVSQYKESHSYCTYYQVVLVVPPLASKFRGGPDVDYKSQGFDDLKIAMKSADYFWTQTNLNKKVLSDWLDVDLNKIKVIPPAVNSLVAKKYLNNSKDDLVVFISRFVTYKRPEIAYRVLKELNYKGKFIMIGGGGGLSYSQFKDMAKQDGINLKIIEVCSDDDKFSIISKARLLLYPSDWEDFGMPPMEVGYFGIPTVAFKNPTYTEVFKDAVIYAERFNYEDFKSKVKEVLNKKELNLDIQRLVFNNYDWDNIVTNMSKALWNDYSNSDEEIIILFDTVEGCMNRGIGDILLTTPIIKALKKRFPNSKIDYYIRNDGSADVLKGNIDIDRIITSENMLRDEYTYHLKLERKLEDYSIHRNTLHRLESLEILFNVKAKDKSVTLNLTSDEIEEGRKLLIDNGRKNICIAIKSVSSYRSWKLSRFYAVAKKLQDKYNIYIIDRDKEVIFNSLENVKNLTGELSVRQVCSLISNADLVITLDSACLHIAGALEKKIILLNGVLPHQLRTKYYKDISVIEKRGNCPEICFDIQRGDFRNKCLNKQSCLRMMSITVNDVVNKAIEVLGD